MRKLLLVSLFAMVAASFSLSAAARGGAGGSGGGFGGIGGGGVSASGGFNHGTPTGPATGSRAIQDSNGRFARDRDRGLERAEDRRSAAGSEHEKAHQRQSKAGSSTRRR